MKADEFLTELFDKPTEYYWKNDNVAEFTVGDYKFTATFSRENDSVYFEFSLFDSKGNIRQDLTNIFKDTQESIVVFSTITNIVLKYLQRYQPNVFSFGADGDEPSRVKLYDRLAQRIGSKFPYALEKRHIVKANVYLYKFTKNSSYSV